MKRFIIFAFLLLVFDITLFSMGGLQVTMHNTYSVMKVENIKFSDTSFNGILPRLGSDVATLSTNYVRHYPGGDKTVWKEYSFNINGILTYRNGQKNDTGGKTTSLLAGWKIDENGFPMEYVDGNARRTELYKFDSDGRIIEKTVFSRTKKLPVFVFGNGKEVEINPPAVDDDPTVNARYNYTFSYDEKGDLVSEGYKSDESDTLTLFIRDAQNRIVKVTTKRFMENGEASVGIVNYEYFDDGRMIATKIQNGNESRREIYKYDDDLLVSTQVFVGDELYYDNGYEYNNRGQKTLLINRYCGHSTGSQWFGKKEWEYDDEGRIVILREYNDDFNPETENFPLKSVMRIVYESSDDTKTVTTYSNDGTEIQRSIIYWYQNGLLIKITENNYRGDVNTTAFTYNEQGYADSIRTIDKDGKIIQEENIVYEYH